jgi:peptidoglycan/LPS O-acetylase OafA/YrhL
MNTSRDYLPQLDTLRAIAVLMVIASHWAPSLTNAWFNGIVGVQLFFVLSGYLITGILLGMRSSVERGGASIVWTLRNFYVRRFLRIFPLFYATLLVTFALGYTSVRASIWWHVTYLSNILFVVRGEWLDEVSHFWSLAVEEQFYLVWPCLILFTPRKYLLPVIAAVVCIAPLSRLVASQVLGMNLVAVTAMPFSSVDTLGLGAMLALLHSRQKESIEDDRLSITLAGMCVSGFFIYTVLQFVGAEHAPGSQFVARAALAPALLGVVWLATRKIGGPVGRLMELRPLLYLGRISYGLYVLHNFVPFAVNATARRIGVDVEALDRPTAVAIYFVVLLAVSSASWRFFEKPLNDLKRFFPYVPREASAPPGPPARAALRSPQL